MGAIIHMSLFIFIIKHKTLSISLIEAIRLNKTLIFSRRIRYCKKQFKNIFLVIFNVKEE
jgi:hypothetical protein